MMCDILQNQTINLRKLKNDITDYKLLEKWYQKEEIYSHFEQKKLNLEEIKNKYYPRTLNNAKVPVYMIEFENHPVGIIQYQLVNEENKTLYELADDNLYEVDIFIGEVNLHNKGIGKNSISLLIDYLFQKKGASKIVMCPLMDNQNAIKCYQNCGFKITKKFETEDTIGDIQTYILMVKEK